MDVMQDTLDPLFAKVVRITTVACTIFLAVLLMLKAKPQAMVAPALIAACGLFCLIGLRGARPKSVVAVYLWSVWLTICIESGLRFGIMNSSLHAALILILVVGWLLGTRQATWMWLLSVAWIGVLILGQSDRTPTSRAMPDPVVQWAAITCIWAIALITMRHVFQAHQQRLLDVQALHRDLSEKVRRLDAQERAMRLTEGRVLQVLAASPLPITVAHYESGVYIDVNPTWERTFQRGKAEVIGKTSIDLGFWKDMSQRQGWIDLFDAHGRVSGHEATFGLPDGSERTFLLSSERFRYGDEDCVLTMSMDVTERKRLESDLRELNVNLERRVSERTEELLQTNADLVKTMDTLRRAQEELLQSEKLASLGSLVAGVAHELNTPIGNALVTASAMAEHIDELSKAHSAGQLKKVALDQFLVNMNQGAALTQRSLTRAAELVAGFKQVAVDQASERRRKFELATVVSEVTETLRPSIRRSGVGLEVDIAEQLMMDSFPGPLGQVLINLINNSVVHGLEGRSDGEVIVSSAPTKDPAQVCLVVSDNGVGIHPDHLGLIFDPFFTTKLGRGGSGLGLSISHRIVTRILGGQIAVHSTVGQGTRFEITLPLVAPNVLQ